MDYKIAGKLSGFSGLSTVRRKVGGTMNMVGAGLVYAPSMTVLGWMPVFGVDLNA